MNMEMIDVPDLHNDFHWYCREQKRKMKEVRNVESWNDTLYLEIYDKPFHEIDLFWKLRLNLNVQEPANDFDTWWEKKEFLFSKVIPQSQIEIKMKREAGIFCQKLINGYQKMSKLKSNVPMGIKNYIVLYLLVEMCIFKEFYWIYPKGHHYKSLTNANEITNSLSSRNIKWQSKWRGPTGYKYETPKQLYYYNYHHDEDEMVFETQEYVE